MEPNEELKETTATDLGALLDAGDGAVVTLVAGETCLVAHRAVVAARSTEFAARFCDDLQEASSGQFAVPDVEGPVLRQLLAFFYTQEAPNVPGMAAQLLAAADNYGLSVLKDRYEQQLISQLSIRTAVDTAILAVRHSCYSLREAAVKFIKVHTFPVMTTQGWADAVRNQPEVFVEVCQLISELSPETSQIHVSELPTVEAIEEVEETPVMDLAALLDAGDGAVVNLVAGDTHLVVHRAVLAARCPVFATKFCSDTQEDSSCEITVPDVEGPVLRQMLAYLYTLQVPQLPSMAPQLLAAADVYDLTILKADCEQQVAAQLSVETATATAILALRHSCNSLRENSINFIMAHTHEVMATQGWAEAVRTQPKDVVKVSHLLSEFATENSMPAAADIWASVTNQPQGDLSYHSQTLATDELPTSDDALSSLVSSQRSMSQHIMERLSHAASTRYAAQLPEGTNASAEDKTKSLIQAAEAGALEELKELLEGGADVGARKSGLVSGWTALHYAANEGHEQAVVNLLAAGAEVDARDGVLRTPLHWAAVGGHAAVVRQLAASCADPNARDEDGLTPLHLAAWYGHAEAVTILLDVGADRAARSQKGNTPMDIAVQYNRVGVSEVLLRRS